VAWGEVFDDDYLYFYETALDDAADRDVDLIWRLLELEPGLEVLDLACGHGWIANRLADRGVRVTGLDSTLRFLEVARDDAERRGVEVDYVDGDMRALPWTERFDRVVSWFTAFGYFDDDENRRVLRQAHMALRPGGRIPIENNNLTELLRRWQPWIAVERDGDFRADTERTIIRGGRTRRFTFSVRMFVAAELRAWLSEAGFAAVESYDGEGEPLTAQGRRMITLARR
jgi:2-polyprenyl-3-methyl-5-hydroxy-6-metoxy-1,4-benzoquinol methylase